MFIYVYIYDINVYIHHMMHTFIMYKVPYGRYTCGTVRTGPGPTGPGPGPTGPGPGSHPGRENKVGPGSKIGPGELGWARKKGWAAY